MELSHTPREILRNKLLLLLILLFDLIGFSLIFPIIPHMLDYYFRNLQNAPLDGWLAYILEPVRVMISRQKDDRLIVIAGGILASLYSFLQFLFTPFWGRLSDRVGRRPVLILTSLGLAASYMVWFFSSSLTVFILSRILGGFMAGNVGVASAAMADMTKREDRTKAMGLLGAAFGVGFVVGPVVGGLSSSWNLMQSFPDITFLHPYSACALISFLLSISSAILNMSYFKETLPDHRKTQQVWVENPFRLVRSRLHIEGFQHLLLVNFIFITMFSGMEFSLSFFYKLSFHLSPRQIGMVFLYSGMVIVIGQGGLVRFLTTRISEKRMALLGLLIIPVPLAMLAQSPPSFLESLLWLTPISLGAALVQPALSGLSSLMAPVDRQGLAMGVYRSSGSLARAVGPLSGAYLYWFYGVQMAYFVLGSFIFLTFLIALGLRSVERHNVRAVEDPA